MRKTRCRYLTWGIAVPRQLKMQVKLSPGPSQCCKATLRGNLRPRGRHLVAASASNQSPHLHCFSHHVSRITIALLLRDGQIQGLMMLIIHGPASSETSFLPCSLCTNAPLCFQTVSACSASRSLLRLLLCLLLVDLTIGRRPSFLHCLHLLMSARHTPRIHQSQILTLPCP